MKKKYWTVTEIAKGYGVSRQAVYKWIKKGLKFKYQYEIGKKKWKGITQKSAEEYTKVKLDLSKID